LELKIERAGTVPTPAAILPKQNADYKRRQPLSARLKTVLLVCAVPKIAFLTTAKSAEWSFTSSQSFEQMVYSPPVLLQKLFEL
jgi:hypothetical protein